MTATVDQLDLARMCAAMSRNDAAAVAAFYSPDAQLEMIDQDHPPSAPQVIRGADAIRAMYDDICGRMLRHDFDHLLSEPGVAAFSETCEYPDGGRVSLACVMDVRDGRIVRQRGVQAWDA